MTNTGGPAFPARIPIIHSDEQGKDYPSFDEAGMSLRDWFAGQALYTAWHMESLYLPCSSDTDVVIRAYRLADAMIAERSK